jgi:HlyD family secretion protein
MATRRAEPRNAGGAPAAASAPAQAPAPATAAASPAKQAAPANPPRPANDARPANDVRPAQPAPAQAHSHHDHAHGHDHAHHSHAPSAPAAPVSRSQPKIAPAGDFADDHADDLADATSAGRARRLASRAAALGLALAREGKGSRLATILGGTLVVLLASAVITTQASITGDGELLPAQRGWVRHPSGGVIERVVVREGDRVTAGQALVQLSSVETDRERARVAETVREAKAALAQSLRGPRPEEIKVAEARLRRARTQLGFLGRQAKRARRLVREGVLSRDTGESSLREASLAANEAQIASKELDQLRAGASREEIEGRRAALARLESELKYLDAQHSRLRLVAPISGVVATPRLEELTLRAVPAGTEILQIVDDSSYLVEVAVREKALEHIRKGDSLSLRLRSNPGEALAGSVIEVLPRLMETPQGRMVVVRCKLAARPNQAIVGMTGVAVIRGERHSYLRTLITRVSRWVRTDVL